MRFRVHFLLRLTHTFRPDGRCPDLEIAPTPATLRLLENHRWAWRARPDGLAVLSSADERGESLIPSPAGARWVFELRVRNPEFTVFTTLPDVLMGPAGYFTNVGAAPPSEPGAPIQLVARARTATGVESLEFPAQASQARYALGGIPLGGSGAGDFRIEGLGGDARVVVEAGGRTITVSASPTPVARAFGVTYPVEPRLPRGVFAEVEIVGPLGPSPAEARAPEFRVAFEARSARWRYFLVTDVPADRDRFTIDAIEGVGFGRVPADPRDRLTQVLLGDYPESNGYRVSSFVSDAPLACRETGRAGLRLKDGDASVAEVLPPPALGNLCLIDNQPGFFHVVQRINQH